jgi:hypothetical protein
MRQSTWNPVRKKMLYVIFLFATFWKKRYPENKRISQTDGTVLRYGSPLSVEVSELYIIILKTSTAHFKSSELVFLLSINKTIIMSTKLKPAAARDMPFLKYTVAVESWRVTAYVFFWTMCIFAICMANLFVVPAMKAGPAVPGSPCGPFNRVSY